MRIFPKPDWKPELEGSINKVVDCCICYTVQKRAFVVFRFGTIVFSDSDSPKGDVDYVLTLESIVRSPPDFRVIPMDDGNYIVRFDGPVCGLVFEPDFSRQFDALAPMLDEGGLLPGEHLTCNGGSSKQFYAGLYARAKVYADFECPTIVARYAPEQPRT